MRFKKLDLSLRGIGSKDFKSHYNSDFKML